MKHLATYLLGCWALVMLAPQTASAGPWKVRVAMVPLTGSGRIASKLAWKTTLAMVKTLKRSKKVRTVMLDRRRARRLRQCLQVPHCVKLLSRKLGVQYLLAGHVTRLGRAYHVDLRVVSSRSGAVVSNGAFRASHVWRARSSGARLAHTLIHRARQGVRVASAATSVSDATTPTNDPSLFSKSEAESAAAILEVRDTENPLKPPEEPKVAQASLAHLDGGAEAAPVVVKQDVGPQTNIFSSRYWHAWSAASVGLLALGAGVTFGTISRQANQEAHDATYQKEAWINRDKAEKNALTANILYGVGGAAVLTSAVLFYIEHQKEAREKRIERDLSIQFNVAQRGGGLLVKGSF